MMETNIEKQPAARRSIVNYRLWERLKEFGFAVPALVFLLVFVFYPIGNSIYLSFTDWNMVRPVKNWVGLENYEWLLQSKDFGQVLRVTFTYTILDVILTLGIGLLFALLFNKTTRLFGFMRGVVFMPYYISMIIAAMVFLWIFNNNYGLANRLLEVFGFERVEWLTNPSLALWPLIIVSIWKGVGFAMILFLAGIRSIPVEYFEASSIDGASRIQQFFKITLPLLSPITLFLVITNFISSMQVFQSIDIMTNGGPLGATNAIVFWIFTMAFNDFRIGRASALIVIFFIIIVVLTAVQFAISKKRVHYEG